MSRLRPIQVYLDSDDYSKIASRKDSELLDSQYNKLLAFVDNGNIEIRYSAVNLLESAHNFSASKKYAVSRAKVITKLCRGRTFPQPFDLLKCECKRMAGGLTIQRDIALRNSDLWAFDTRDLVDGLQDSVLRKLESEAGCVTRADRRRLKKKVLKNGKFRPSVFDPEAADLKKFTASMEQEHPALKAIPLEERLLEFLTGQISSRQFSEDMAHMCFSPIGFTYFLYDFLRSDKGLEQDFLRRLGRNLVDAIDSVRTSVSEVTRILKAEGKGDAYIKNRLRELSESWMDSRNVIASSMAPDFASEQFASELPIGSLPALDFYMTSTCQLIVKMSTDTQGKLSVSDHADMLHASYVPYVDVFRADKRTRPLFRKVCEKQGVSTYFPDTLEQAVDWIEQEV